jgi:hypothetical protein
VSQVGAGRVVVVTCAIVVVVAAATVVLVESDGAFVVVLTVSRVQAPRTRASARTTARRRVMTVRLSAQHG